jgi:hypothetical protein
MYFSCFQCPLYIRLHAVADYGLSGQPGTAGSRPLSVLVLQAAAAAANDDDGSVQLLFR